MSDVKVSCAVAEADSDDGGDGGGDDAGVEVAGQAVSWLMNSSWELSLRRSCRTSVSGQLVGEGITGGGRREGTRGDQGDGWPGEAGRTGDPRAGKSCARGGVMSLMLGSPTGWVAARNTK